MSKTWDTKKKIIKLLSKGNMTLTEISAELGLAPSTVSKHIEELKQMGAINMVDNPYIKKWKYYTANSNFDPNEAIRGNFARPSMPAIAAAVVIIAGIFIAYGFLAHSGIGAHSNIVNFELTDPPQVPAGTQALIMSYSSIRAHVVGQGAVNGSWVSGKGNGTLDLMGLVNATKVIGSTDVPANSTINMVSFSVTNMSILINGTYYNVEIPNSEITVNLNEGGDLSNSSSVLIDLSPTILTVFTDNSTIFIMVPSAKAIVVGSGGLIMVGSTSGLNTTEKTKLNLAGPSVTITSESLLTYGRNTTLSVTVKNNGSSNVNINSVLLKGNFSALVIPDVNLSEEPISKLNGEMPVQMYAIPDITTAVGSAASSAGQFGGNSASSQSSESSAVTSTAVAGIQVNVTGANATNAVVSTIKNGTNVSVILNNAENSISVGVIKSGNLSSITNVSIDANAGLGTLISIEGVEVLNNGVSTGANSTHKISNLVHIGVALKNFKTLDFLVGSNGTLSLPANQAAVQDSGYVLAPGASATFKFSGMMSVGNGQVVMSTITGSNYNLTVVGNGGLSVSTNVTS